MTNGHSTEVTKDEEYRANTVQNLLVLLLPAFIGVVLAFLLSRDQILGFVLYIFVGVLIGVVLFLLLRRRQAKKAATPQSDVQGGVLSSIPNVGGAASSDRLSVFAVLSLILSVVVAPLGIVLGHVALVDIRRTHDRGRGLAIAGLIVGYLWTAGIFTILAVAVASR